MSASNSPFTWFCALRGGIHSIASILAGSCFSPSAEMRWPTYDSSWSLNSSLSLFNLMFFWRQRSSKFRSLESRSCSAAWSVSPRSCQSKASMSNSWMQIATFKLAYMSTYWSARQRIKRWICMYRNKTTRCWDKISISCFLPPSQLNVKAIWSNHTDDWISFLSLERNYSDRRLQHKSSWCKLQAHQGIPGCRLDMKQLTNTATREYKNTSIRSSIHNTRK